ncbi:uncharacterized protein LOC132705231 [Cylas formicarius]|uniref:uncharacterized protein LOC132705231 n=1 Tax=Cylas formicarius TaxID=197179 RepID=UPI0029583D93|nr:uncharacterized protein LOC132705231 [Cylas formicarius]XP_060531687.1 uncharacterized protein LOC132705231 [Cylas formicarius]XP_060531688.1 uncharacterized protein LOC132705231 [Cylas formicarius]XP_060531689.1 uncharacterized protein LOC132705231 [Cylas formicarius]
MAERESKSKRKTLGRSASTESTEYSTTMGRSVRRKKPKERWLLSRKTWRYMADAGRKLIPDGARNCPEDVPKIEAYFQEVCKKEPRFLLWRKNSYPGALGFRRKRKQSRKGGSCRKAVSADDVDVVKPERPRDLLLEPKVHGKFDLKKMKEDFLNSPTTSADYGGFSFEPSDDKLLINMLERYLRIADSGGSHDFDYQDLMDKLQRHLSTASDIVSKGGYSAYSPQQHVHFQGDHVQRTLRDTLSRYFSHSSNRDRVISDLLTDRKALEKLYFDLRKARGFRGGRGGTGYSCGPTYTNRTYNKSHAPDCTVGQHPPPLIEVESESVEVSLMSRKVQTVSIPESVLQEVEAEYRNNLAEEDEKRDTVKPSRRRSSVDNDDVSQSVSDTIKRYLRMARKKSVEADNADRFKRVNYDRNLRNIKAKGEITKPGDDDGLNKGCQTNDDWILTYRELKMAETYETSDVESRASSARSSVDAGACDDGVKSSPSSPPSVKGGHSFLSQLLHGKHDKNSSSAAMTAMQKSKSSSSVVHQGSKLVAKKIFRSRSKSQTRPSQNTCSWIPRGSCVWNSINGRQVVLGDTNLLHLTEIERKVLQKVSIAKLQALNLGVAVKIPSETVGAVPTKPKRRPYLLKRKALTTSIFDGGRKEDGSSPSGSGLVFGIPLTQCVENDRLSRIAAGACSPLRSGPDFVGPPEDPEPIARHSSRASFSSLIDASRCEEGGSCESLVRRDRMAGSVPGLLDAISCGSVGDLPCVFAEDECAFIPNILSECIRHLERHGLHTSGIFRVSASKKRLRQLREDFDCGRETTLDESQCPHDVASLLKEYLRDLPDPLLCRDLYHAFVHTQRIRNRRLQTEALQHLVHLLPPANRDTLYALLSFLATVARHSDDGKNDLGEEVAGNKMDSNNLATVFAPNILHCLKPGSKDVTERSEDRLDVINVVRMLIDHFKQIFLVPAKLLDEVYVHMMDSHPEELDQLLNKKDGLAGADESVDELDSETNSAPWTPTHPTSEVSSEHAFDRATVALYEPKRTYSREECLHEAAATGGPNIGMRIRHKDRIKERSLRRKREKGEDTGSPSSSLISRIRNQKDDEYQYTKNNRSSSLESTSSTHTDSDVSRRRSSPYVLDNGGVITASLTIPVQQSYNVEDDIPFIEEGGDTGRHHVTVGVVRAPPRRRNVSVGSDSSVASGVQPITASLSLVQSYDSAVGSSATCSSGVQNTPTSVSSSIADAGLSSPPSWASTPPTSPESVHTSVSYIPELPKSPKGGVPPKVSFATVKDGRGYQDISKSPSIDSRQEPKYTPSITTIGNAVMKSKTADFERIIKPKAQTSSEKKKYTKRRYTDSRHPTRHIPDSEFLESSGTAKGEQKPSVSPTGPVYKRRELISSVPSK